MKFDEEQLYIYRVYVDKVVDGDTIYFNVDQGFNVWSKQKVRLENVDTPEIFRPINEAEREHGYLAKAFVEHFLKGDDKKIYLVSKKTGKYGRWLGTIYVEGENYSLNEELVNHGLIKNKEIYENI